MIGMALKRYIAVWTGASFAGLGFIRDDQKLNLYG